MELTEHKNRDDLLEVNRRSAAAVVKQRGRNVFSACQRYQTERCRLNEDVVHPGKDVGDKRGKAKVHVRIIATGVFDNGSEFGVAQRTWKSN